VQELKEDDNRHKRRRNKKARTRLYRAFNAVKKLPQSRTGYQASHTVVTNESSSANSPTSDQDFSTFRTEDGAHATIKQEDLSSGSTYTTRVTEENSEDHLGSKPGQHWLSSKSPAVLKLGLGLATFVILNLIKHQTRDTGEGISKSSRF
jgi:hypothetical protein